MKSYANDLLDIACTLMKDASAKCSAECFNVRDLETMRTRVKHEGLSFLTITMPTFAKDFDIALANGIIDSSLFQSFRKCAGLPAFLQGFLNLVFEKHTRRLLDDPDICAIEGVRQIGYAFKKVKLDCTDTRVKKAFRAFEQSERVFDVEIDVDDYNTFVNVSKQIWNRIFYNKSIHNLLPRHGPGATAEKLNGNKKYKFTRWHKRLEPFFPLLDYSFVNSDGIRTRRWRLMKHLDADQEQPVRVIDVPKTLKTRRVIAIEPVCMQYAQQALAQDIIKTLETDWLVGGHINFHDQEINRQLALRSSRDGRKATLDESSASDRVPRDPALRMFDVNPDLRDAIDACRSLRAELPCGKIITLKKFASMGSALCFPVEAMYFYTICVIGMLRYKHLPCSMPSVIDVAKDIYVYGDDIIVPTEAAEVVIDTMHKYYCKVNVRKSFFRGKFRESCGMDAFDGHEVTPTYFRHPIPDDRRNASGCVSLVETCNHLHKRGYWLTADLLRRKLEKVTFKLPIVTEKASGLGLTSFLGVPQDSGRWNEKFQRREVKAWRVDPFRREDPLDGEPALFKSLLNLERKKTVKWTGHFVKTGQIQRFCRSIQASDDEHLEASVRRGDVTLKRRWICPSI